LEHSISKMSRPVRRRLQKIVQFSPDKNHARRANALLLAHEGIKIKRIAALLQTTRTSVRKWLDLFRHFGEAGLVPNTRGRHKETVTDAVGAKLLELVEQEPTKYGYARTRWTSEMLAEQLREQLAIEIHASTIRRLLPELGVCWTRARPTLIIQDPKKALKMKAINKALQDCSSDNPVFYVDEVDVDLNPRIGNCWSKKGKQVTVPTPGKNVKRYLCGALHAQTKKVLWVEWEKKNTDIFLLMMAELKKQYRRAKQIRLILDNYRIHKSHKASLFLKHNPKFKLLFQPAYHPWVNKIELFWKKLHDTVTRNHRFTTMNQLMTAVHQFMENASVRFGTELALCKN
jgi:transposase